MNKLKHIAIIADGNGRWAETRGLPRCDGHDAGLHKIDEMLHWCVELDIPVLSVYCFSIENWNRPKEEVDALIMLANKYFDRYEEFAQNNVRVVVSGTRERLSDDTIKKIETVQEATKHCDGLILNLCCNYSGKKEIEDAIANGARTIDEIDRMMYQQLPLPDLIIRTGGHQRLSNFMIWQAAYAELYFTHTLFPDLSIGEFRHIKKVFESETRKFGGVIIA